MEHQKSSWRKSVWSIGIKNHLMAHINQYIMEQCLVAMKDLHISMTFRYTIRSVYFQKGTHDRPVIKNGTDRIQSI